MVRLLFTIKYDGTAYHGWQVQENALSVQQCFQDAVEKVFLKRLDVKGCSRTDSGVHANGYRVSLDTDMDISPKNAVLALNTYLPPDIAAVDCVEVPLSFHPRYNCKSKRYVYKIYNGKVRDPFLRNYAYYYRWKIDEKYLNEEAAAFLGTHDFTSFCSSKGKKDDPVRTITVSSVRRAGDMVYFTFEGDGFLYNMVRIMVGTLLFVNEGKIKKGGIPSIISSKNRQNAGRTAPPQGLYLDCVNY